SQKYLALAPDLPPAQQAAAPAPPASADAPAAGAEFSMEVPPPAAEPSVEMLNLKPPTPAAVPDAALRSGSHELDMNEWESMLSVDSPPAAAEAPISMEVSAAPIEMPVEAAPIEIAVEAPVAEFA